MLLNYLFASVKLEQGNKKYLALVLILRYTVLFYGIGCYIIRNGGLNKKVNTIQWRRMYLEDLFCLEIIFTTSIEHLHSLFHVSSLFI